MSIYLNSIPYKGLCPKGKDCFIKTKNSIHFNSFMKKIKNRFLL